MFPVYLGDWWSGNADDLVDFRYPVRCSALCWEFLYLSGLVLSGEPSHEANCKVAHTSVWAFLRVKICSISDKMKRDFTKD